MAVGFVANRTGVLPREGNKFLTNLLIKVIAPCMIFSSITSKELTDDTFAATLYTLLGAALFFFEFCEPIDRMIGPNVYK